MRKVAVGVVAVVLAVSILGCWGPQKLTRRLDDWTNQTYVENPWMMGNVLSATLLHALFFVTNLMDVGINAYYFWARDAEPFGSGTGTEFKHKPVTPPVK
jgi:hypothetical protein